MLLTGTLKKATTSYQNYYAGHINKHGWANKVKESFWPDSYTKPTNMIAASDVYECDDHHDFFAEEVNRIWGAFN